MSTDEVNVKTPLFSFGISKSEKEIIINEGDTVIIRSWSWKKFKFDRKAVTVTNGKPEVTML